MAEIGVDIRELTKGHPDRNAVAAQIKAGRKVDSVSRDTHSPPREKWNESRTGKGYVNLLHGIQASFDYVRQELSSGTILDIGTGSSIGATELAKSSLSEGLTLQATSLTRHPEHENNLGNDNITLTSAELLRDVEPNSLGMILGIHSFAYSPRPELVVAKFNQVLVEGGLIKRVLRGDTGRAPIDEKSAKEYVPLLEKNGFDVTMEVIRDVRGFPEGELLYARKRKTSEDPTEGRVTVNII